MLFEPRQIRLIETVVCPSCDHFDVADTLLMQEGFRKNCIQCGTGMLTEGEMYAHLESISARMDEFDIDALLDEPFHH